MRCIPPVEITDARLTSSTVPEPAANEVPWDSATSYTVGQRVIRTQTHRVYEAAAAGVHAGLPEITPTRWIDVGPTLRWAMFDQNRNTPSTSDSGSMTVVIYPGQRVDSIFLGGLVADEAVITMTVPALGEVYRRTERLLYRSTTRWSEYYTGGFRGRKSLVRFDLPLYSQGVVTVTVTRASGPVSVASLVLGQSVHMGCVQYGATDDGQNFSRIERDPYGGLLLTPRPNLPISDQVVFVEKDNINRLRDLRSDLAGRYAVWSGLDDMSEDGFFEGLLIAGVYRRFQFDFNNPQSAILNLQLEEAA